MLTVTEKAINFIMNLMQQMDKPKKVRIVLDDSVSDTSLGLVLDETAGNDDTEFVIQGIHFVIARNLYEKAKPIDIDFVEYTPGAGFKITSGL